MTIGTDLMSNQINTEGLSASARQALEEFRALPDREYVEVWRSLSPPDFTELDGEYRGQFPPNYNEIHKRWQSSNLFNAESPGGYWLGKAYRPLGQATGEGYNMWRMSDGRVERRIRYGTHMGASRVDGHPALVMTYSSFNRSVSWESDTVDEIRKLADGVYVGLGTHRLSQILKSERNDMLEVFKSYGLHLKDSYEIHERTPAMVAVFLLTGPVETVVGPDDPTVEDQ